MHTVDRWRLTLIGSALLIGLVGTGCGTGTGETPGTATPTTSPPTATPTTTPPPTGTPTTPAGWQMMAAAPVPADFYAGVWTGREFILHAPVLDPEATNPGSIDAAYNPATGRWRRLPSSPYPVQITEAGVQAVWDGTELLAFGTMNAAYNPATNRWRPLRSAPMAGPSIVVWTGNQVLFWGGGCCDEASAAGAAYDPVRDTWQAMPPSPLAGRHTAGAWTGTELIIVGGEAHGVTVFADAAAYNPTTRTWRRLPPLPAPRFGATVTWTGTEVLVVGGKRTDASIPYADGLAYRPATNTWRRLPAMQIRRSGHVAVWTGHQLLVWGGQSSSALTNPVAAPPHGLAYDPATNRWSPMPVSPLRARTGSIAIWTGTKMLIWGGQALRYPFNLCADGATYRP